jgi:hypothetical protein
LGKTHLGKGEKEEGGRRKSTEGCFSRDREDPTLTVEPEEDV